jgi:hypothetical protein
MKKVVSTGVAIICLCSIALASPPSPPAPAAGPTPAPASPNVDLNGILNSIPETYIVSQDGTYTCPDKKCSGTWRVNEAGDKCYTQLRPEKLPEHCVKYIARTPPPEGRVSG